MLPALNATISNPYGPETIPPPPAGTITLLYFTPMLMSYFPLLISYFAIIPYTAFVSPTTKLKIALYFVSSHNT